MAESRNRWCQNAWNSIVRTKRQEGSKGIGRFFFRLLHIHDDQNKCVFSLFDNFKHIYYIFPEFTAHTVYLCMHYVVYYKHAYVANFGYDFWSLNRRDFNPLKHEFLKP